MFLQLLNKHYNREKTSTKTLFLSALFVFSTVAIAFTPLRLISYIVPIILLAYVWPTTRIFNSYVAKLILSFIILACYQQVVGIVLWALKIPLYFGLVILLELLLVGFVKSFTPIDKKVAPVTANDTSGLIVSIGTVVIIAFGIFARGPALQQLLRFTTTGFDHTSHVSLTLSVYDNRGFTYGPADEIVNKVVYKDFATYPQGWHLNNSLLWYAFDSNLTTASSSLTRVLSLYVLSVLLWFGIILFLLTHLILYVSEELLGKKASLTNYISAMGIVGLAEVAFLIGMLRYGFGSYLPVLVYTLAVVAVVIEYFSDTKRRGLGYFMVVVSLLTAGLSLSWLLAIPVGLVSLVAVFWDNLPVTIKDKWHVIKNRWPVLLLSGLLLGAAFIQVIIQLLYDQKSGQLNEPGAIGVLNVYLLVIMLFACLTLAWQRKVTITKSLMISGAGVFLLAGYIYAYQYYTVGLTSYYSTKVGFLVLLVLFVFGGGVLVATIQKLTEGLKPVVTTGAIVCLIGVLPLVTSMDLSVLTYATGSFRKLSPYSASQIANLLATDKGQHANVVNLKQLDYDEDLVTTHFVKMLSRKDIECQRVMIYYLLSGQQDKLIQQIRGCSEQQHQRFYVLASNNNYSLLQKAFAGSDVTVLLSN